MKPRTFTVINFISMALSLAAAVLSITGIPSTGFYPGIVVLLMIALIPIASKLYVKKAAGRANNTQGNYYTTFTIINLVVILVVLWMAFVIVHDRVLHDCC